MISMLGLPRTLSENPLYQAAFSMRPFEAGSLTLAGEAVEYVPLFTGAAKTELFVELVFEKEDTSCSLSTPLLCLRRKPYGCMAEAWKAL